MDASAWADEYRAKIRGHDGTVRRRGTGAEHPLIEEVRQTAREHKGQAVSDWLEETETKETGGGITRTISGLFSLSLIHI